MRRMKAETAPRHIESFYKRFGESHLYFACHAALPIALTPDLLYLLWNNFQRDINGRELNIPWIAVADLLLSGLCHEVGHELYEMDLPIRNSLLSELKNNHKFGKQRINELASFLLNYSNLQLNTEDQDIQDLAQTQKLTALAYLDPNQAARQLAFAFASTGKKDAIELLRITSLVERLSEPLYEYRKLLIYSKGISNSLHGNIIKSTLPFLELLEQQHQKITPEFILPIPETIKIKQKKSISPTSFLAAYDYQRLFQFNTEATTEIPAYILRIIRNTLNSTSRKISEISISTFRIFKNALNNAFKAFFGISISTLRTIVIIFRFTYRILTQIYDFVSSLFSDILENSNRQNYPRSNYKRNVNYGKWSLIIGSLLAVPGAIVAFTIFPEIACKVGLNSAYCTTQKQVVDLVIQSETGEPLSDAEIQVIGQGAPIIAYTDNEGYAKVQIPREGDVRVHLSKPGYPSQNLIINLKNSQSTVRIIRFSQSGQSKVEVVASVPPQPYVLATQTSLTPNPIDTATPTIPTSISSTLLQTDCQTATPGANLENIVRRENNFKVTLGREVLPLLVYINDPSYNNVIDRTRPIEFVCKLNSDYKELKLVYGVHSGNSLAIPGNKLTLTVFLDGKPSGNKTVVVGSKQEWILPLQGVKNVSLRTECTVESCPSLSFTEMSLIK